MEDIQRGICNHVMNAVSSLLTSGLLVTGVVSASRHLTDAMFSGHRADLAHLCWEGEVQLCPPLPLLPAHMYLCVNLSWFVHLSGPVRADSTH